MDTSKEYIKMCDCEEIQKDWVPQYGDYIAGEWLDANDDTEWQELGIVLRYQEDKNLIKTGGDILWNRDIIRWLPRQDQLQGMFFDGKYIYNILDSFCEFFKEQEDSGLTSAEQLWLAFVMKEKHNKTWDKDKWRSC